MKKVKKWESIKHREKHFPSPFPSFPSFPSHLFIIYLCDETRWDEIMIDKSKEYRYILLFSSINYLGKVNKY